MERVQPEGQLVLVSGGYRFYDTTSRFNPMHSITVHCAECSHKVASATAASKERALAMAEELIVRCACRIEKERGQHTTFDRDRTARNHVVSGQHLAMNMFGGRRSS